MGLPTAACRVRRMQRFARTLCQTTACAASAQTPCLRTRFYLHLAFQRLYHSRIRNRPFLKWGSLTYHPAPAQEPVAAQPDLDLDLDRDPVTDPPHARAAAAARPPLPQQRTRSAARPSVSDTPRPARSWRPPRAVTGAPSRRPGDPTGRARRSSTRSRPRSCPPATPAPRPGRTRPKSNV